MKWRMGATPVVALVASGIVLALGACATDPGRIETGMAKDDVVRLFGPPSFAKLGPQGGELIYATGPAGDRSYVARIDAQGRVESVQQVLTFQGFDAIEKEKWTRDMVEERFGPPGRRARSGTTEVWDYRYRQDNVYHSIFTVTFDASGLVAKTENGPDQAFEMGPGGGRAGHGR